MLRKSQLLALVFFFALPFAHADEASKRAKLDELFAVMKLQSMSEQVMKSSMDQGEQIAKAFFGGKPPSAADQKILDDYKSKIYSLMAEAFSWEKLKPIYLDLYASAYTEADVDGMLAFYKSPAGQHSIEKSPILITASQNAVANRFQDIQGKLQALTEDMMEKVKAAHKDDETSK